MSSYKELTTLQADAGFRSVSTDMGYREESSDRVRETR